MKNKIIYLLKFRDNEIKEICLKKFTKLYSAERAAAALVKSENVELICIDKYNCNTLERIEVKSYKNGNE